MSKKLSVILKERSDDGDWVLAKELEDKVQSLIDERNKAWFKVEELTEQLYKLKRSLIKLTTEF